MKTPDIIYLIDEGDCVSWCDDPNPCGAEPPPYAVRYIKTDLQPLNAAQVERITVLVDDPPEEES